MTHEMETTIRFMQDSSKAAGFGNAHSEAIEKGIMEGKKEIPLEVAWKEYPAYAGTAIPTVLWQPKLTEQEKNPGRYNFGYEATLVVGNKEPVKQFFSIFKLAGVKLDQSKELLEGNTVIITDWDNKENKRRDVAASLDLSKKPNEGENHPVIRIPLNDLKVGSLYSKEDVVASQAEKDRHLQQLQNGEKIDVTLRHYVNKVAQYYDASLQFNIKNDEKGLRLEMTVRDPQGQILRTPSIEPKQAATQTLGVVVGMEKEKPIPEHLLKLLPGFKKDPADDLDKKPEKKVQQKRA